MYKRKKSKNNFDKYEINGKIKALSLRKFEKDKRAFESYVFEVEFEHENETITDCCFMSKDIAREYFNYYKISPKEVVGLNCVAMLLIDTDTNDGCLKWLRVKKDGKILDFISKANELKEW